MPDLKIDLKDFREYFEERPFISEKEIRDYLQRRRVHVTESTLRWHIHRLKETGALLRVKPGTYTLQQKTAFQPRLDKKTERLYHKVTGAFSPDLPCVIWSTGWLHQFMVLQPTQHIIILETEKEWMESLFRLLKDEGRPAFLNPAREILEQYVLGREEAFIVKPFISRAPTQHLEGDIESPMLEKMLVDLFIDDDLFAAYQGSELENIFLHAWKKYFLNLSALINYAKRRRRDSELLNFVRRLPDQELYNVLSK